MLLILMYHQIVNSSSSLDLEISIKNFENHLSYLQTNFNIVVPGENILKNKISVCLTFNDAYVDLYHYIFPLLKKFNIPAVLGITAGFIENTTNLDLTNNLGGADYYKGINEEQPANVSLCTWEEIRIMVRSGFFFPASNSLNHKNLKLINKEDAYQEICRSKRIISLKLETIPEIFIYPFDAYTNRIHEITKAHYKYIMRMGEASNSSWEQNILYRINADQFWKNQKKISNSHIFAWKIKQYINKIRSK
jgi:Polysaccharide deacetylase